MPGALLWWAFSDFAYTSLSSNTGDLPAYDSLQWLSLTTAQFRNMNTFGWSREKSHPPNEPTALAEQAAGVMGWAVWLRRTFSVLHFSSLCCYRNGAEVALYRKPTSMQVFFFKCPFELPYIGAGLWGWITYPHVARTDLLLDVRLGVVAFVREWKSRGHLKNFQPFQPVGVNPEVEKQICRTQ